MNWSPKKTDKLEVRLAPEIKQAFLVRCQSKGHSASEAIRAHIEDRLARASSLKDLPLIVRSAFICAGVAAFLFGVVCIALACFGAIRTDVRLGLTVFLTIQGGMYAGAALALVKVNWRVLIALLPALGLIQLVYAAEVNPPASLRGAMVGIVIGGMGPTLLFAVMAAAAWGMSARHRRVQIRA